MTHEDVVRRMVTYDRRFMADPPDELHAITQWLKNSREAISDGTADMMCDDDVVQLDAREVVTAAKALGMDRMVTLYRDAWRDVA